MVSRPYDWEVKAFSIHTMGTDALGQTKGHSISIAPYEETPKLFRTESKTVPQASTFHDGTKIQEDLKVCGGQKFVTRTGMEAFSTTCRTL